MQDALAEANAVLLNEEATQEEVDEAYDNLQAAINGLDVLHYHLSILHLLYLMHLAMLSSFLLYNFLLLSLLLNLLDLVIHLFEL